MSVATLPPPVDIDSETKKAVIAGVKAVLDSFRQAGLVEPSLTYAALISQPEALAAFIEAFRANRAAADAFVKDGDGQPVHDDHTQLSCPVTLAQIEHLLVRTCARKLFESTRTMETVTETVTHKSMFGLIKRTEQVERQSVDPIEERKDRQLLALVAYAWQLPLLDAYRHYLTYSHIIEIGEDLLALPTEAKIAEIGALDPALIRKVKTATGPDFSSILADRPQAIIGISVWNRDMYEFYRKMLGDLAWTFFARDSAFFNACASLDKAAAKIYGDVLCYLAADNLIEIQRLNLDKTEVLINAMRSALGPRLPEILSLPHFAKDILRKVVDQLLHSNHEKDKLMLAFSISFKALVPTIDEWLATGQAEPVPGAPV
ncbi:hypothetical protein [Phaeospirillum tilakii]|uniref:Uncharacterized protein n=1 Tax=Phaeospirillum tilakii TaxID=741673 RepID=A0ABW5CAY1_9PROT